MSAKKLLLLTALVALLFGFIVFFERKMPSTAERERKGDLYWEIPAERLERLELNRAGEKVGFEKTGTGPWRMVKPDSYPADSFAVNGVASELAELKRAGGDSNDARPADYGLEKPAVKATIVWSDVGEPKVKKSRTIEFGMEIPGTDIAAARTEGSSKVLFVPASTLSSVKKSVDDFRSREIFGGSSGEVSRLEILRGRGRLVLSRKDGIWWLVEPLADLADASEADRLVGQLTALRAREFIRGGEDLAAQGLNPPLFRVTVTEAKGTATAVDFGATRSDGNSVYARREGQVVTIDRDIVDELSKEAVAFRSPALVGFNRSDVTELAGTFGKTSIALSQKNGGWTAQGHPVLAAAADDILTAVLDLKSKSFLDEGEAKKLVPAVATVTVRTKAGAPWMMSLHPRLQETVATVSARPGGFLLDRDVSGKLEAAFQKAISPPTPAPTSGKR
ncbi:MAG TPA: DUF4340 domain-containing protein [Thermoanaerobaculia bacterium]